MASPIEGRALLDVNASVDAHKNIVPNLLAAHALTGCDTVASPYGIGKLTALKVLKAGACGLDQLGQIDIEVPLTQAAEKQPMDFMLACYGQVGVRSLTEARQKLWTKKVAQRRASAPPLCSLPPTNEAFKQNVLRAQLQMAIWLHALDPNPPDLDVTLYGWSKSAGTDMLIPTSIPDGIALIPEELVRLIRCSCQTERPCRSQRCSCKNAGLSCSPYCSCRGESPCNNVDSVSLVDAREND